MGTAWLTGPFSVRPTKAAIPVGARPIAGSLGTGCSCSSPDVWLSANQVTHRDRAPALFLPYPKAHRTLAHACERVSGEPEDCGSSLRWWRACGQRLGRHIRGQRRLPRRARSSRRLPTPILLLSLLHRIPLTRDLVEHD